MDVMPIKIMDFIYQAILLFEYKQRIFLLIGIQMMVIDKINSCKKYINLDLGQPQSPKSRQFVLF